MSRTLQPEDVISHYRIIGPLGAGGMGEVYLALDETLERNVALKILPPRMFKDDDRVRRFILEAKSASSLNHPHIVTIYEIGQAPVQSKSGTAQPGDGQDAVHFISMELVAGETLTSRIHQEKTDLRVLLGFLAQAAEGLAKAHAAGIVHRDLKPGNIMVTKDGYAKVLDFGLAKLVEQRSPEGQSSAPTEMVKDLTGQGMVLGTIGYMSPEQVRGSVVDHRSDIFSFGCVLYEAATRRRPFVADTSVETMHKILNEKPVPIEEIAPQVPAEVRRLIRRCLAKSADQRLQSMKDLAIELREIVDEYDALSAGSGSGGATTSAATAAPMTKSRAFVIGMIAVAVLGVTGVAFGIYGLMRGRTDATTAGGSFQSMKVTTLLSEPDAQSAILSADGRYLAYTLAQNGLRSLHVRQVTTGGDVEILKPQRASVLGLAFSPDGDYLYYQSDDLEHPGYRALLQVPSLGGVSKKRGFDVDTTVTFSPDGKRVAFRRGFPQNKEDHIIALDLESGTEKTLAKLKTPAGFQGHPSWSPDGHRVAVAIQTFEKGIAAGILMIDPESGRQESLGDGHLPFLEDVSWLSDGSGLVFTAAEFWGPSQVWFMSYPAGQARRITNDQNTYDTVSVAKNGSLAAIRHSNSANIWTTTGQNDVHPITRGAGVESAIGRFDVAPDGTFVAQGSNAGSQSVIRVSADGSTRQPISSGSAPAFGMRLIPGGVLYSQLDGRTLHIWRAGATGDNAKRVTDGPGEVLQDASPDGTRILFSSAPDVTNLSTMPSEGGERVRIADDSGSGEFSPDGKLIRYNSYRQMGEFARSVSAVVPATGGQLIATVVLPGGAASTKWTPDSKALAFVQAKDGVDNIYRQPITGGEPVPITHFKTGRIGNFTWSRDGSRLQMTRSSGPVWNIWVTPAGGGEPVPVTNFKTGVIFAVVWGHDGKTLFFTYGDVIQDVVLIRDFK